MIDWNRTTMDMWMKKRCYLQGSSAIWEIQLVLSPRSEWVIALVQVKG